MWAGWGHLAAARPKAIEARMSLDQPHHYAHCEMFLATQGGSYGNGYDEHGKMAIFSASTEYIRRGGLRGDDEWS